MLRTPANDVTTNRQYAPLCSDIELNDSSAKDAARDDNSIACSKEQFWIFTDPRPLRKGWRFGVFLGFLTCLCVLLLNLTLTIWASTQSKNNSGHIFQGSCAAAKRYNMGLHVVINVLSTLLLGASNYCMQCLSAPTRTIITQAHKEGKWADIGVQSLINLRWSVRWKKVVWALLVVSSLPLHLL